ncbi:MAG: hypothetical protein HQL51_13625 [Magnetococcales bacterium]|nr:hypothetical protein [Magnetococcales bacterium]
MEPPIEAVFTQGVIQPSTPVSFAEGERLVILRAPESVHADTQPDAPSPADLDGETPPQEPNWHRFIGILRDSPVFKGDPVAIQRAMRDEWD